jgi:hypothetical protein
VGEREIGIEGEPRLYRSPRFLDPIEMSVATSVRGAAGSALFHGAFTSFLFVRERRCDANPPLSPNIIEMIVVI